MIHSRDLSTGHKWLCSVLLSYKESCWLQETTATEILKKTKDERNGQSVFILSNRSLEPVNLNLDWIIDCVFNC